MRIENIDDTELGINFMHGDVQVYVTFCIYYQTDKHAWMTLHKIMMRDRETEFNTGVSSGRANNVSIDTIAYCN